MLENLKPHLIWKNFEKICSIPHPSKKEDKIRAFIVDFAKNLSLETKVDEVGNIIVKKPASSSVMSHKKTVILQAHIDMVPQKNADKKHDFENDPIEPIIDGEWIRANKTTLGADNGIGVAAMLSILESKDLNHGPIECLFTNDEEDGMTGAFGLKSGLLDGEILLNLDSEDEGEIYVGCAGGVRGKLEFEFKEENIPANSKQIKITLNGLKGGHSGLDINIGRGNANKLMNRVLFDLNKIDFRISKIEGGNLANAIPRESVVSGIVPESKFVEFKSIISKMNETFKNELIDTEPSLQLSFEEISGIQNVIEKNAQDKMIRMTFAIPNGVLRMSSALENLVETSNNLAVVKTTDCKKIKMICLTRSSVDSAKDAVVNSIQSIADLAGVKSEFTGSYPGWKPNMKSEILSVATKIYEAKYGKTPKVKAIHAGLECGLFGKAYPKWDMISFGPTIRFPHSPDEKVNIKAVEKFWDYLINILEGI